MTGKTYTLDDFRVNEYAYSRDTITATGWGLDINFSDILSRLIQEAGRYCERYASDLFIDWASIEKKIEDGTLEAAETFLFGFRANGVDHTAYILSRYNSGAYSVPEKEYRSLWRLDITSEESDSEWRLKMVLGRVF